MGFKKYDKSKNDIETRVWWRLYKQLLCLEKLQLKVEIEGIRHMSIGDVYLPTKIDQMMKFYGQWNQNGNNKFNMHSHSVKPQSFSKNNLASNRICFEQQRQQETDNDIQMRQRSDSKQTQV